MKQSVSQILDFFKKHKYGKVTLALLIAGVIVAGTLIFTAKPQKEPIPLSDVAAAISAGKVEKIEDSPDSGVLTIYYQDGTEATTRRDTTAPFLEQMTYL